jgi:PTS system mannose-specific IIC component
MPVKKYLTFLVIGFVFAAYLNLPILGVSLLGLAFAYYFFTQKMAAPAASSVNGAEAFEGDDFDE